MAEPTAFREAEWVARIAEAAGWDGRIVGVPRGRLPVPFRTEQPLVTDPTRIRFSWVKGHGGDQYNDLVDRLAVEAANTQRPRRGTGRPDVLGRPDRRRRVSGSNSSPAGPEAPTGHLIVVTGLRPAGFSS